MKQEALTELTNRTAYVRNHPITDATQMTQELRWDKRDEEWNEWSKEKFWSTHFEPDESHISVSEEVNAHLNQLLKLRDKLLTFGGEQAIIPPIEEDINKILERGQLWFGDCSGLVGGAQSSCHRNSAVIWKELTKEGREAHITTGYALSLDGLWRQHTWVVLESEKRNLILETTVGRIAYFGFALTVDEAERFLFDNF